jgi:methylglutamate dehydrogenase subunit D
VSDILAHLSPAEPLACGRYGPVLDVPGVKARRLDLALATLTAGRGTVAALSDAMAAETGVALPSGPGYAVSQGIGAIGIGPGRWTITAEGLSGEGLVERLEAIAGLNGSVCDQSDGAVVFELSGTQVRNTLMKMLNVDIDPAVFGTGSAVTTPVSLIGATIWQTDDMPVYRIAVACSYTPAFLRALVSSAAEYGFELA